jgi:hypothetical protein
MTLEQAGLLIAGADPHDAETSSSAKAAGATYSLAIKQAVTRAYEYAHAFVHDIDELAQAVALGTPDIWEMSYEFDSHLPSLQLRHNVGEILEDPDNVPLHVPVDPWFSETVYGGELLKWMERNEIDTAFAFLPHHQVIVTERASPDDERWPGNQALVREKSAASNTLTSAETSVPAPEDLKSTMPERSLPTRRARTMLTIIAGLCKGADIEHGARGAAKRVVELAEQLGVSIDEQTVLGVLREIPDALEARGR